MLSFNIIQSWEGLVTMVSKVVTFVGFIFFFVGLVMLAFYSDIPTPIRYIFVGLVLFKAFFLRLLIKPYKKVGKIYFTDQGVEVFLKEGKSQTYHLSEKSMGITIQLSHFGHFYRGSWSTFRAWGDKNYLLIKQGEKLEHFEFVIPNEQSFDALKQYVDAQIAQKNTNIKYEKQDLFLPY